MIVSAFLSSDTAVGLCINCHFGITYVAQMDASFCFYRHKQILSHGWICFVVWLNFTAESVNSSLFLKNLEKTFLQFDLQKKLRQTHRKFTATFIGKIYRR